MSNNFEINKDVIVIEDENKNVIFMECDMKKSQELGRAFQSTSSGYKLPTKGSSSETEVSSNSSKENKSKLTRKNNKSVPKLTCRRTILNNSNCVKLSNKTKMNMELDITKQIRIYNCFEWLSKNGDMSKKLINNIISYVKIGGTSEIPLKIYKKFNEPYIISRFDQEYLNKIGNNFEIRGYLALNSAVTGIHSNKFTKTKIGIANPCKGFYITANSKLLDFLRTNYNFKLSGVQLEQICGFIYGYIHYSVCIVPINIEITLGYNIKTKEFEINVTSFEETIDLLDITEYLLFMKNYTNDMDREKYILQKTLQEINNDIYSLQRINIANMDFKWLRKYNRTKIFKYSLYTIV